MGVVNVTPDSFSDGGMFFDLPKAVAHGEALLAAGAHLLDIGGESTRPGAQSVSLEEELQRVIPVLQAFKGRVALSIDTSKAEVARQAIEAGASLVNDVTAGRGEPELLKVAARGGAAVCLMHMKGTPRTMQQSPTYADVVGEVREFLREAIERAVAAGVPRERVLIDPGIGFGKTFDHNLSLLKHLGALRELKAPIVLGTSRKAFLGHVTGGKPAAQRVVATAATVAIAAFSGVAEFVRVHDVAEAKDAAAVGDAIREAT